MNKEQIIDEIRSIAHLQIASEHNFRLGYLRSQYAIVEADPRIRYYQLIGSALWMSLYSHINWLAHFKFLKPEKIAESDIATWLSDVLNWPSEVATAFWFCGRNPIAHTGSQNLPYSMNVNGAKRYIVLSFNDPDDWPGATGAYMALPISRAPRPTGVLPIQQTTFFYKPTEDLLQTLLDDVSACIAVLDHNSILRLQKVMRSLNFFEDDGTLARINNLLDVYDHVR